MALKAELSEKYCLHHKDTGSAIFQIILLSEEIEKIKSHLSTTNE
ncbi:14350_t:CDS:1, partial [Funneliformis geosporum]